MARKPNYNFEKKIKEAAKKKKKAEKRERKAEKKTEPQSSDTGGAAPLGQPAETDAQPTP